MFALILALTVSVQDSLRAEFSELARGWVENARADGAVIDSVDAMVFERIVEELGFYIDDEYSERKRKRVFSKVNTPAELSEELKRITGKDFEKLYTYLYVWSERDSLSVLNIVKSTSEHFVYIYSPGSPAARDIDLIKLATERAYADVVEILGIDSFLEERLGRIVHKDTFTSAKIPIKLYQSRMQIGGPDRVIGGETIFKPIWLQDTIAYILEIRLAYPGPAALYGIPHEMAHALALLFLSDMEKITAFLQDRDYDQIRNIKDALPQDDYLRSEGWAYSVQFNHITFSRLGLISDSREKAYLLLKRKSLPDIEEIMKADVEATFKEKIISAFGFGNRVYAQKSARLEASSADFIRFLHQSYGSLKLTKFLTNPRPPHNAVLTVYQLTARQLEHKWHEDLIEKEND